MKLFVQYLGAFAFAAVVFAGMKTANYLMGPLQIQSQIIVCLVTPEDTVKECRPFQDLVFKEGV